MSSARRAAGPPPAQVYETHTGVVLLCGERAYKTKKPLRTDFLDFSTPALREHACARELRLNARLTPDVYLGVAQLTDPEGGPAEPVLVMRRMPADRRLSALLAANELPAADLTALVELLADFHRTARRGPDIDHAGTADALRDRWRALLDPLRAGPAELIDPQLLDRIDRRAMTYLAGRADLFGERIAQGRIVDGHGDLLTEDIFDLDDGFRILDCLDFDDQLRYVDGLDDIAFLAMDIEYLGHFELADAVVASYQRAVHDPAPVSLRDHYIAYRAAVRAKVDLLRAGQGDSTAGGRLRRHLRIAEARLDDSAVRLVLVGGLPGTGKSTVATRLAERSGAALLSSDHLRKEMVGAARIGGELGRFGAGRYSPANRTRVYDELLDRARGLLTRGVSVILDASWTDQDERARAATLAEDVAAELIALRCVCPRALAHRRLGDRRGSESDATAEIADAMAACETAWSRAVTLDTSAPLSDTVASAHDAWHRGGSVPTGRALNRNIPRTQETTP
ncbi:AAA family ATPase [Nocardia neocaledoniensis]|uniref:bifunctional aminoglycoside phosphotransferase/ATP-binding protein n=1 Tax=Nocardia neocaledoniensis TaxID=236511 RepID=UPI0033D4C978